MNILDLRRGVADKPTEWAFMRSLDRPELVAWSYALGFIVALALGIAYLFWLDSGCELSGVMTWAGKVCI